MGAITTNSTKAKRTYKCCFSPHLCRGPNAIVRMFARIKNFRRIVVTREVDACHRLMSIPGVGPITALAAINGIGNTGRFAHARTAGAYFGVTLRRYYSGEIDYQGRISKPGGRMVRTLLYEAANVLLTKVTRFSTLKSLGAYTNQRGG